jgi:hypothetical protein
MTNTGSQRRLLTDVTKRRGIYHADVSTILGIISSKLKMKIQIPDSSKFDYRDCARALVVPSTVCDIRTSLYNAMSEHGAEYCKLSFRI